ncbi:MAG: hypothetical protein ACXVHO_06695 [Methanobacterium sp.]
MSSLAPAFLERTLDKINADKADIIPQSTITMGSERSIGRRGLKSAISRVTKKSITNIPHRFIWLIPVGFGFNILDTITAEIAIP